MTKCRKYTAEDIQFIKDNIDRMSYSEMAKCFSDKYGYHFKMCSIQKVAQRNGISKFERVYKNGIRTIKFDEITKEKEAFILEKFVECNTYEEIAQEYENTFHVKCTSDNVRRILNQYGLHTENIGKFKKGGRTRKLNIGTERVGSGYRTCVKVSENDVPPGNSSNWMPKSRYMYIKYHGCIPDDCLIIHLDGNKDNYSKDNLYAINRKVMAELMRNKWCSSERDVKLAGIKYAELISKLKQAGEGE